MDRHGRRARAGVRQPLQKVQGREVRRDAHLQGAQGRRHEIRPVLQQAPRRLLHVGHEALRLQDHQPAMSRGPRFQQGVGRRLPRHRIEAWRLFLAAGLASSRLHPQRAVAETVPQDHARLGARTADQLRPRRRHLFRRPRRIGHELGFPRPVVDDPPLAALDHDQLPLRRLRRQRVSRQPLDAAERRSQRQPADGPRFSGRFRHAGTDDLPHADRSALGNVHAAGELQWAVVLFVQGGDEIA